MTKAFVNKVVKKFLDHQLLFIESTRIFRFFISHFIYNKITRNIMYNNGLLYHSFT